jgi:hypothetical protein
MCQEQYKCTSYVSRATKGGDATQGKGSVSVHEGGIEIVANNLGVVESSQDRDNDIVVGEVKVEGLVNEEASGRIVQRSEYGVDIGSRVGCIYKPVQKFQHLTISLCTTIGVQ